MSEEITLCVHLPEVYEDPYRIEVRCGKTSAEVYEHGHRGSGDWAAWKAQGYTIGSGGTVGYTQAQALADAREYVARAERARLFQVQLRTKLGGESQ